MHQLFPVAFGKTSPACSGGKFTEYGDVAFPTVQTRSGEQSFFQRVGKVEPKVVPHVRNVARREEEHRAAILRESNSGADQLILKIAGEQRKRLFVSVFGHPGDSPRIVSRVGGRVEKHQYAVKRSLEFRREHLDVEISRVPVAKRLSDIKTVFQTG